MILRFAAIMCDRPAAVAYVSVQTEFNDSSCVCSKISTFQTHLEDISKVNNKS